MADKALVSYLRKNLKQFGSEALTQKLLGEGITEAEIQDALTETLRPSRSRPRWLPYALLLAIIALVAIYFTASQGPNDTSSAPSTTASGSATSHESAESRIFMGNHGYVLQLPAGYKALSDFKDPRKIHEVVYLYPEKTDPTTFSDEGLYGQLGIVRLEATPRETEQGRITIDTVRAGVATTLRKQKAVYISKDMQVNGLPAFYVNVSAPFPIVQAFIVGSKVLYVLTGGIEPGPFTDILNSLHEVSEGALPPETSSENSAEETAPVIP